MYELSQLFRISDILNKLNIALKLMKNQKDIQ